MSDTNVARIQPDPEAMAHVLGTGDLGKLTTAQRVAYYANVCRSVGLNPLTRPFRFLTLNNQVQLYATRDCTDQLRGIHKISLVVKDQRLDGDLFVVTVAGSTPDGRRDEVIGAVTMGRLQGESRANAAMKAITKAKRRVTLSICGLGLVSEDELDTMPGARTFAPDEELPAPASPASPASPDPRREEINTETPMEPTEREQRWLDKLDAALGTVTTTEGWDNLMGGKNVRDFEATASTWGRRAYYEVKQRHQDRIFVLPESDDVQEG